MFKSVTGKIISIGFVAFICFVASQFIFALISERESRYYMAQSDIGNSWGHAQTFLGPVLVFDLPQNDVTGEKRYEYVLPEKLSVESILEPEVRRRGIFETVVYVEKLQIQGVFSKNDFSMEQRTQMPSFTVSVSDVRSIEEQIQLTWTGTEYEFAQGTSNSFFEESGMHVKVPITSTTDELLFSFELSLKGSGRSMFTPLGKETLVTVNSVWDSPAFVGAHLPSKRTITERGFSATWNISSFGRAYPQTWSSDDIQSYSTLLQSSFGVELHEGIGLYSQVERSVKYAVLFILIPFITLFLFEALTKVRIHPIQYLFVGSALAMFYLLLLALTEHLGFFWAYCIAAGMITFLVTTYSRSVLEKRLQSWLLLILLGTLYSYLYLVLKVEDYALLLGSIFVFVLLGGVMYVTRKIDWYSEM